MAVTGFTDLPSPNSRCCGMSRVGRGGKGMAMELHSEKESYRATIVLRTPEGEHTTVIVMRRGCSVWITFDGAIRTTAVMSDPEACQLVEAITAARRPR